jgi:hypothetical protein
MFAKKKLNSVVNMFVYWSPKLVVYTVTTITEWDRIMEGIYGLLSVNLDQQLRAELLDVDQYAWHVEYIALTMNDWSSLQGLRPLHVFM